MKKWYPVRKNGRFINAHGKTSHWLWPTVSLFIDSWKESLLAPFALRSKQWIVQPQFVVESAEPKITWLGHATFLIQIGNKNILTDPIFGNLSWFFSRIMPSVVRVEDLPRIDYVVLSHNHPDHMDGRTLMDLQRYFPDMKVLVPMGDKAWFDYRSFAHVSEHMWWEQIQADDVTFTFLPSKHWSQRSLFDKNKSLWGSWMIQAHGYTIYFAGDTAWGSHFGSIGELFPSIDIALMPVGPGRPRRWMKHAHVNAEEACRAFLKLKAKVFIPMHWGTFHLGLDRFAEPILRIQKWWHKHKKKCRHKLLYVAKVGELMNCAKDKAALSYYALKKRRIEL